MFAAAKKAIENSEKIAIFNHKNPDGDAMGTAYALKLALISAGKKAEVFIKEEDKSSREYSFIKDTSSSLSVSECDLLIAVDSSDVERLGEFGKYFETEKNTISFDHHISHIPFSKITLLDANAPACGQLLYEFLEYWGVNITKEIAHNLYVAVAADTGSFKYSSTTEKTHLIAAKLIEHGADVGAISKKLFDTNSFEYLKMMKIAIGKLEVFLNGKLSVLCLDENDFKNAGLSESEAGGIVSLTRTVEGVLISAYLRPRDNEIKVSLRSESHINAAKIAEKFGGGGHIKAAGFSIKEKDINKAKEIVINAISGEIL